jgi:hypothetical protein
MTAIAGFRTIVLNLLNDSALTYFTNDNCDYALRLALEEYTRARPLVNSYILDCTGDQEITFPADFAANFIVKVELYDVDPDNIVEIPFQAYQRDSDWIVRTTTGAYAAGEILIVTYSTGHTIDGLDSAAGTTIPSEDERIIQIGGAGFASQLRFASQVEPININDDVVQHYKELADYYLRLFHKCLETVPSQSYVQELKYPDIKF